MTEHDYVKEVARLAHKMTAEKGTDYYIAIEKVEEKLLSDRVGAHKSVNSISKEFNYSISPDEDIDNGEVYNIKTGEVIEEVEYIEPVQEVEEVTE